MTVRREMHHERRLDTGLIRGGRGVLIDILCHLSSGKAKESHETLNFEPVPAPRRLPRMQVNFITATAAFNSGRNFSAVSGYCASDSNFKLDVCLLSNGITS